MMTVPIYQIKVNGRFCVAESGCLGKLIRAVIATASEAKQEAISFLGLLRRKTVLQHPSRNDETLL